MAKRVLFTIPNFDTAGSGGAMLKIAEGLDKNLFDVHIACFHNRGEFFKKVVDSGISVHLIQYVSPARPLYKLFINSWRVSRKFLKIAPDIIHSYHYSADYSEALAAKFAGIPWVFTKKNMSWGGASSNSWKLRSFLAKGIAIQNSDMRKDFYAQSDKTFYLPRGVDLTFFTAGDKNPEIRAKMETATDKRVVICVANMVPVKGIELLIKAFAKLYAQLPEWVLWLVGDVESDYGTEMIALAKDHDLEKVVRFSGKVPDVKAYLDQAEIFVLPTKNEGRKEGSPVSLLEAMANAKMVIASKIPGVKDQLAPFPNSLFNPGDEEDLALMLGGAMRQTADQNRAQGKVFQSWVSKEFPLKMEIERHQTFYKNILGC